MSIESIFAILCIILALPICLLLEIILRGKPNNMVHDKERKELLEIYKKEKGL